MITAKELRAALVDLVKVKAGLSAYEVHFDNVKEASGSYFYIKVTSRRKTFDQVFYERSLAIDLQLILLPDGFNRIHRSELYDAVDALDRAVRPVFHVKDRFITVQETRSRIVDGVLHYEFDLDFADYLPVEMPPHMETLAVDLSVGNLKLELKEETEDGE